MHRNFFQGCGVGVGRSRVLRVGVEIFYPTPTTNVQFFYILVMLTAQLTRLRAAVECSAVIFLKKPCRVSREAACKVVSNLKKNRLE